MTEYRRRSGDLIFFVIVLFASPQTKTLYSRAAITVINSGHPVPLFRYNFRNTPEGRERRKVSRY